MDERTHDRITKAYWDLMERVQTDPEYAVLGRICDELEEQYEAIAAALPTEHREVLERYITARESRNRRVLEFACKELTAGKENSILK